MNQRHFFVSGIVALVLATTLGFISPVPGPAKVLAQQPLPTVTIVNGCGGHVSFTNVPTTWTVTIQPGNFTFWPSNNSIDIELDPNPSYSYVWTDLSGLIISPGSGTLDIHGCPGSSPPVPPTVACATRLVSFTNTPAGWQLVTTPTNSSNSQSWDSNFGALGPFLPGTYDYQWYNGVLDPPTNTAYRMADAHNHSSFVVPTACPTPTLATNASAAVVLGNSIHDSATLSGGNTPSGAISFRVYGPADTSCTTPIASYNNSTGISVVSVSGNITYTSVDFTPTSAGTYRWIANYGGDANNAPTANGCNGANESVVVSPAPTATPTATPTHTPAPTASSTPTATPTVTPTPAASSTPTATPTITPTPTTSPTLVPPVIGGSSSEPPAPWYLILGLLLGAALVLAGGAGFLLWKHQMNPGQNEPPSAGPAEDQSGEITTDSQTEEIAPPNEPSEPSV